MLGPTTFVGFDSAWTDKPKAPGAICAVSLLEGSEPEFHEPRLAGFDQAREFIHELAARSAYTLVAIDQPTIVRNDASLRPVERVMASLISWLGGGVQPSHTGRIGMFCASAPIWGFLHALGATEDPEAARTAPTGLWLAEVFPAAGMPALSEDFFGRLRAPRYNPARRKTFRMDDWQAVCRSLALRMQSFGCADAALYAEVLSQKDRVTKADQDKLDSLICLWIGMYWRRAKREHSLMIGSLEEGYMILPAPSGARQRLSAAAEKYGVAYR